VIEIAARIGGVALETVTPASHFRNDLEYDSLDAMEFVMAVEDAFKISVPDEAGEKLQTVGEAIDFICDQTAGAAMPSV
jgi:acyl carrier protein